MSQSSAFRWHPFEHQLYRELQGLEISNGTLLVMVSGGADSIALLAALAALVPALKVQLQVLYCHHGNSKQPSQIQYRDRAEVFVREFCKKLDVSFYSVRNDGNDESEAGLRDFRKSAAEQKRRDIGAKFSVWGHHRDDFLETQILRLIRGVGPEALFEPMRMQNSTELRPFLELSRDEIRAYLRDKKFEWVEDPSNLNQDYLRNWLRQNWLPALEEKCPGALSSFSRSLGLLQESHSESIPSEIWSEEGLVRTVYLTLNEAQKKQVIAQYLRRCGKLEFSQNQIKEVVKQLDISQLSHTFKAATVTWLITRESIKIASPIVNRN